MNKKNIRIEKDSMGEFEVPESAKYGASTARAVENFPISNLKFSRTFIKSIAEVKKACALVNERNELLSKNIAKAIVESSQEVIDGHHDGDFVFLKKLVKENNSKPDKSKELNYPIDKKITYKLESKDKRITKINNEDDIKNYIIGDENEIEEIVTNFSNKFDDSKEIKLNKGELAYLSIDYNKFKEIIDDITIENIIKINNNIYSFNYDIETIMIEDKYSKQLYELYDASIFDKKFKPTKIYFDDNINYEKIRSDYEKLILTKDIFIKNNDKIKSIEDTFLIEETSNYYKIN